MNTAHRIKCNQCGGDFQPRNWMRHRKACNRRMREQRVTPPPAQWELNAAAQQRAEIAREAR